MDIRELRSFVTVVHAGSISRAAQELHIAQPAISRQIAKLEEELKTPLLVRHGRGVALTPAGGRLLERAEMMLQYLGDTVAHVHDEQAHQREHLSIGLTPAIGQIIGPTLIRRFRETWPLAQLHAREGLSTSLQSWLLDGQIEVAIVYNQPLMEAFDLCPLFSEPMVLIAPPGEPERPIRFADIVDRPLILPALPHSNRRLIEQAAVQNGVRLNVVLEVDSAALTRQLVHDGVGYSITAQLAVRDFMKAGRLVARPIERPSLRSSVAIATLHNVRSSRLAQTWNELMVEELRKLVLHGAWSDAADWLGN
ncbi:LysR family transcriptional regulator [Sphingomonas pseudosanguinis]|uniref:LysR family transcriptional regulator n=1 Tax=Sphingomonas pseudosanguinis TaxID=413712 RepID=UPI003F8343A9